VPLSRYFSFYRKALGKANEDAAATLRELVPKSIDDFARSVQSAETKAISIILDQVKALYADVDAGSKSNEAKANTILGFLGGGLSVVAITSGNHLDVNSASAPMTIAAAALIFLVSLGFAVFCLLTARRRGIPEMPDIRNAVESGALGEAATTAYLVRVWQCRLANIKVINARKAQAIEITQQLFLIGTITVVASFLYSRTLAPSISTKVSTATCKPSPQTKSLLSAETVICTFIGDK
jgi:hypothetical protein